MASYTTRPLYGGAITVSLPSTLIDASDVRQVPDHQEVFLSPTTLTSLIFEINQYVNTTNDTISINIAQIVMICQNPPSRSGASAKP